MSRAPGWANQKDRATPELVFMCERLECRAIEKAMMAALRSGLPITLLLDLTVPGGPNSAEIARHERASLGTGSTYHRWV